MIYNYLELSLDDLLKQYYKNKDIINYNKSKIKQGEKLTNIFFIVFFFSVLLFGGIGIFDFFGTDFWGQILFFAFLFMIIYTSNNTMFFNEEKTIIINLENQNEFIATILETKYHFYKY